MQSSKKGIFSTIYNQRQLIVLTFPFLIMVLIFNYFPLWGWLLAFKDYKPYLGFQNSEWVGFKNFVDLFSDVYFFQALRNTLVISFLKLIFNFLSSITFAILLNEIKNMLFKRTVQTISYLPHFVSWVVAANIVYTVLSPDYGIINELLVKFHILKEPINFLGEPKYFWLIAPITEVWKEMGWNAIIYLAAMTNIDPQLYEAASIDGAGRLKRIWYITLPGILPTVKILLIMNVGWILNAGFEQMYLLQRPSTLDYSDILETYILRYGIGSGRWSYATAAGIFNSVVSLILVTTANRIASKIGEGERVF
ncbi:carbohydrate ABC transporter membrane protein 1 (CUT1 family) [Caldicellulosiruptor bescii]|uniref:Binding-protein-dependent transport systems inner membrane component n=2 Tax=Caldicellulosiruptor bescii TaxID=31899 RepID=B9MP62_CALBD|nr:ABC transporter permease subunit [Caldicellulosiruptor bescii]ACM61621.1 binding-protein-dependent transport systems inner membrane component [Caldicellulosiruptor bescii DSM 6725]PBC88570.1 carbohydrate ABC transporter membrane protein 1 (CUT1 family) [Caldicellulosiruptor bescii]PBC91949.1 carbohydrate ABC transporter membrane protein 1 (CUT1 family) [Caldicellulosiruptor bescii]PBD02640.1 carbohydrate ABC transporter membrane protein 1 (CUT1 family) [Caldicellulosiruptor bescii]PBD05132.